MEAWGERSPVIFVTGSSTLKRQGSGGFKEIDDVAIAAPLTKYSATINDGERINEFVDRAFKIAMNGAYKALNDLKEQKVIKAIGVGLNDADICTRFANEGDFDCMLLAGRYTLLDQTAVNEFFPIAKKNNIGIILGGVFNSGILAKGIGDQITYRYDKIPIDIKGNPIKSQNFHPIFSTILSK